MAFACPSIVKWSEHAAYHTLEGKELNESAGEYGDDPDDRLCLTQAAFAGLVNVDVRTVNRWASLADPFGIPSAVEILLPLLAELDKASGRRRRIRTADPLGVNEML